MNGFVDTATAPGLVLDTPLRVGILNAAWNVQRHNTDHRCVLDMARLSAFDASLDVGFVPGPWQSLRCNANFVARRLGAPLPFPRIRLANSQLGSDVLYQYGSDLRGIVLPSRRRAPPLMATTGFPSLRRVLARGADFLEAQARIVDASAGRAGLLHFHTDTMRELYLERRPQDRSRALTLPFFLPHLRVLDEAAVRDKFAREETLLLFVGADGKRKGIETLCEALDAHADTLHARRVRAVIVSRDTPGCQRFKALRHERQLPREQVQALMREAHLYCMVPHHESYGLVFVEAMAAGCAVLADDDLPRQEMLDGGRCGALVPSGDAAALGAALLGLVDDRKELLALALRARERAAQRHHPLCVASADAQALSRLRGG